MKFALHQLLRKTEQSILDAEERIEEQRAIVAEMESAGADVQIARELLRALRRGLSTLAAHRDQLRQTLPPPARGTGNDFQLLAVKLFPKHARPIDDETDEPLRKTRH